MRGWVGFFGVKSYKESGFFLLMGVINLYNNIDGSDLIYLFIIICLLGVLGKWICIM